VYLNKNTLLAIWTSEAQMHNYYVNTYIQSAGTGAYGAAGSQLSGPPRMTLDPSLRLVLWRSVQLNGANITAIEAYQLDKLELIGLAKHDPPVVFGINRHSAFSTIGSGTNSYPNEPATPTGIRPLTDFETSALAEIKAGQDVVTQPETDGTCLIVGPVRAQQACIQCHNGYQVGDALGAFTYHLSKVNLFENSSTAVPSAAPAATAPSPPVRTGRMVPYDEFADLQYFQLKDTNTIAVEFYDGQGTVIVDIQCEMQKSEPVPTLQVRILGNKSGPETKKFIWDTEGNAVYYFEVGAVDKAKLRVVYEDDKGEHEIPPAGVLDQPFEPEHPPSPPPVAPAKP
jgi:hypothetical protein